MDLSDINPCKTMVDEEIVDGASVFQINLFCGCLNNLHIFFFVCYLIPSF